MCNQLQCVCSFTLGCFMIWASQVALVVKNPLANSGDWETQVWSLGQEDTLEEGMATHSSILAWRIPWTEEPGGLQSLRSRKSRTQLEWPSMHTFCDLGKLIPWAEAKGYHEKGSSFLSRLLRYFVGNDGKAIEKNVFSGWHVAHIPSSCWPSLKPFTFLGNKRVCGLVHTFWTPRDSL